MSQSNEKTDKILKAAFELFGTKGFHDTKMSDIADAAGIAKGTLYLYFSSKEQLYEAMTKHHFETYLSEVRRRATQNDTFDTRLRAVAEYHLLYYYEHRKYKQNFMQGNGPHMMELFHFFITNYIQIVENMIADEQVREPLLKAKGFIGMLEMYKMDILYNEHFKYEQIQLLVDECASLFIQGYKR
ncbi:TetR/AcrR family transcriptional regulator [Longirhabdus pacifica]|uniref:TetR/AcrR family transcriptional regulator n=1 Tax=Longirhabdus pacifica TaxID=2305227 RepID=UPI001008FB78|nr:TetR/AcrR family transcriptional regulator [Longirhabdus pacifica]